MLFWRLWSEYLRKLRGLNVEKNLFRHHGRKHGFPRMVGSLDYTDWEWFGCPYAFKAQYVRRDHGSNPFILLDVVCVHKIWIWHAFFGVVGSNNDINVLYQSPLFDDLKTGRAREIHFVANGVTYSSGYYLVDRIHPEMATLVRLIPDQLMMTTENFAIMIKQVIGKGKDVKQRVGVLKKIIGQY
ncbi:ALP1-like protein [Tanacetum coccineum]